MIELLRSSYNRVGTSSYDPKADYILCFLFYLEAIFFFPTDPILIIYAIERPNRALYYAMIATLGSVLGGLTSYLIGMFLWQLCGEHIIDNYIVSFFIKPAQFGYARSLFQDNAFKSIFMGGFFFIPFKVTTLTAGFCKINLFSFLTAATIVRATRFFFLSMVSALYGERVKHLLLKRFKLILALLFAIIAICYWIFFR